MEAWFRRLFFVLLVVAGVLAVSQFGLAFWAQNEFAGPESVVTAHATMLARDGTLYYGLNRYPYTVSAYTPLFYLAEASLYRLGIPARMAGRGLSIAAWLALAGLMWRILIARTRDPVTSAMGLLLFASNGLLLFWGTIGQVDVCAAALAIGAFYLYSLHEGEARPRLPWPGLLCCLAFFTKQTMIACPIAIFSLLWFRDRKAAIRFGAGVAGTILAVVLGIDWFLDGRFVGNIVRANINPFAIEKLGQHMGYLLRVTGPLVAIAVLRFSPRSAFFVYLAAAAIVFFATAGKVGSDLNYQIETTALCIVCACLALHSLKFFRLTFEGSKTWVTLLQIPLGVYLLVNLRLTANQALTRFGNEREFRAESSALEPYLAGGGRLLSSDYNAMAQIRGNMEVETLIYTLLVNAGRVDPEPLRRDLANQAFETVLLFEDLSQPPANLGAEILSLTAPQRNEIQKRYRLVAHVPGPYLDGVYVYRPHKR